MSIVYEQRTQEPEYLIADGKTKVLHHETKHREDEEPQPDEPLPFNFNSELFFVRSMVGL